MRPEIRPAKNTREQINGGGQVIPVTEMKENLFLMLYLLSHVRHLWLRMEARLLLPAAADG